MSDSQDFPAPPARPLPQSRRALLIGAGVTCAAVLTGCTTYDANNGGFVPQPATSSGTATAAGAASPASGGGTASAGAGSGGVGSGGPPANLLASTSQVPEGSGKIIDGKNIVLTQPEAGTFKGFSAVCTHEGCIVSTIANGTIDCPCHGSRFSIKDGSVVNGPATRPLPPVAIQVEGTSIVQG